MNASREPASAPPAIRPMGPREWAMLVALSVLWGGTFYFNAIAVKALPPFTVVFFRVCIAAAALFLIMKSLGGRLPLDRPSIVAFFGMGALNNLIPFTLYVWAQYHIPGGLAAILNATTPLFTVLLLHVATSDEKATATKLVGVAVGLAGVTMMIGVDALWGERGPLLGQLAAVAGGLSYSFSGLWGRRFARLGIQPVAAATGQMTAASLLLLPFMLVFDQPWTLPPPGLPVVLSILGLALLCTALAYILFFRILAASGATNLHLVTFLIPISAVFFGVVLLGEHLLPRHFMGMALIGCGLAFIDGRLVRRALGRA